MIEGGSQGEVPRDPTLVFVHGWCGEPNGWRFQMAALAKWRKVAVTLVPEAVPSGPQEASPSIADCARHVADHVRRHVAGPVVLVGHSLGGPVALEAALDLERQCLALIGVDTFTDRRFYGGHDEAEIADRLKPFERDFEGEIRRMLGRILAPGISKDLASEITASMLRADRRPALALLRSLLAYDIRPRWPRLAVPAFAINSAWLAAPQDDLVLPKLGLRPIEAAGHFPMLEAPDRFNAILAELLARIAGPSLIGDRLR